MVILTRFRSMIGVVRLPKLGGLRPPTLLITSGVGSGSIFFIFDLKTYEFQGLDLLSNNFLIIV